MGDLSKYRYSAAVGLSLGISLGLATGSIAQTGPGIPRITFKPEEVGTRLYEWDDLRGRVPKGEMFQGYLMMSQDRGSQISLVDITDPRAPRTVFKGATGGKGGDDHVVPSAGTSLMAGGKLVDFANPMLPKTGATYTASGFLSVWPAFQWPYLYSTRLYDGIGKSSPLFIADFRDTNNPRLAKSLDAVSKVGFPTGTTHIIGNLLIITSGQTFKGVSVWDIGDPVDPQLLSANLSGRVMYTSQLYGQYLVTNGPTHGTQMAAFDYSDPENIQLSWQTDIKDMGDYSHFQNGYFFGGGYRGGKWVKVDFATRKTVLTGQVKDASADPKAVAYTARYVTPLGNMLWIGDPNDVDRPNKNGHAGLYVHAARPDSIGPTLLFADPPDGATRLPLTSRFGLAFDEYVDSRLLDSNHIALRPKGGAALAGVYGHTMGVVNFTPNQPLKPNTTYEWYIPQGAVKDWTGNANTLATLMRFSTGATIEGGASGMPRRSGNAWRNRTRLHVKTMAGGAGMLLKLTATSPEAASARGAARVELADGLGRAVHAGTVSLENLRAGWVWYPAASSSRRPGFYLLRLRAPGLSLDQQVFLP